MEGPQYQVRGTGYEVHARHRPGSRLPKPPFAPLVLSNAFDQMIRREIGKQYLGEHEFGVRGLPEQKIGQSMFTRRANDEIGIGHTGKIEVRGKRLRIDGARGDLPGLNVTGQPLRCLSQLKAAAIVEGEDQVETLISGGQLLGLSHPVLVELRDPRVTEIPHEVNANSVGVEVIATAQQEILIEVHQEGHFFLGT